MSTLSQFFGGGGSTFNISSYGGFANTFNPVTYNNNWMYGIGNGVLVTYGRGFGSMNSSTYSLPTPSKGYICVGAIASVINYAYATISTNIGINLSSSFAQYSIRFLRIVPADTTQYFVWDGVNCLLFNTSLNMTITGGVSPGPYYAGGGISVAEFV